MTTPVDQSDAAERSTRIAGTRRPVLRGARIRRTAVVRQMNPSAAIVPPVDDGDAMDRTDARDPADADGYMRAHRRFWGSVVVMGVMWIYCMVCFLLAANQTFASAKQSATFPSFGLLVPEISPADVPVNITTLVLLVASLNVALVVSELGAVPAGKAAYHARWAEMIEYTNFGAAVISLVLATTVLFWDLHAFFLCAPLSILTVTLAASAHQRSGAQIHRRAVEERNALTALQSLDASLATGAATPSHDRKGAAGSIAALVLVPAVLVLPLFLLFPGATGRELWIAIGTGLASSIASIILSVTGFFMIGHWAAGRRLTSIVGWVISGAAALFISVTPLSLTQADPGVSGFVALTAGPYVVHAACWAIWKFLNVGPYRTLHQLSRWQLAKTVAAVRKDLAALRAAQLRDA